MRTYVKTRARRSSIVCSGLLVALCGMSLGCGSAVEDAAAVHSLGPNPLPRQIAELRQQADQLERDVVVDSGPLVTTAAYASADDFVRRLDELGSAARSKATGALDALRSQWSGLVQVQNERAERLARLRKQAAGQAPNHEQRAALDADERELLGQQSQLLALGERLKRIDEMLKSPQATYDARAIAELAVLRDIERACDPDKHVELSSASLSRARELVSADDALLATRAACALAVSGPIPPGARQRIASQPAAVQAKLYQAMLLSGPSTVQFAAEQLKAEPKLLSDIDRGVILPAVERNPASYASVLPLLVAHSRTPAERLDLLRAQLKQFDAAWLPEIRESCRSGQLKSQRSAVVERIVLAQCRAAYSLANELLDDDLRLPLPGLTAESIKPLVPAHRALAIRLAQHMFLYGPAPERRDVLSAYGRGTIPLDVASLSDHAAKAPPADIESLINALIADHDTPSIDLARAMLARMKKIDARKLVYRQASREALANENIHDTLVTLAAGAGEDARAWAWRQTLGEKFCDELARINQQLSRADKLLTSVLPILEAEHVLLPGQTASGDRGLEVAAAHLSRLPSDPGSSLQDAVSLVADLRHRVDDIKTSAAAWCRPLVEELDQYLADLEQAGQAAADVLRVYRTTIVLQLPGAKRGLQQKPADSWQFRLTKADRERLVRDLPRYRQLKKSIDRRRLALASMLER